MIWHGIWCSNSNTDISIWSDQAMVPSWQSPSNWQWFAAKGERAILWVFEGQCLMKSFKNSITKQISAWPRQENSYTVLPVKPRTAIKGCQTKFAEDANDVAHSTKRLAQLDDMRNRMFCGHLNKRSTIQLVEVTDSLLSPSNLGQQFQYAKVLDKAKARSSGSNFILCAGSNVERVTACSFLAGRYLILHETATMDQLFKIFDPIVCQVQSFCDPVQNIMPGKA